MHATGSLLRTADLLIRESVPNFLRIHPNPYVAQTCLCLARLVSATWPQTALRHGDYPSCLANSREEALGGAVKLARFSRRTADRGHRESATEPARGGLLVDPGADLADFASTVLTTGERIEYVPRLVHGGWEVVDEHDGSAACEGPIVLAWPALETLDARRAERLARLQGDGGALLIVLVEQPGLAQRRRARSGPFADLRPDVVVFGESFVRREVPFGAFAARPDLLGAWMRKGWSTFHSTTFQPNSISTRHFVDCLRRDDPDLPALLADDLARIEHDPAALRDAYRRLFSPQLAKLFRTLGTDTAPVAAAGHSFRIGTREVFDGVAGVACSIRGHNPPRWTAEIAAMPDGVACREEVGRRLAATTGLPAHVPAVSGAAAVEHALRLALCAQFPRRRIVALAGGFGGKTLLALAGTAKGFYKTGLDPLYPHVAYVDPFAPDANDRIDRLLDEEPVAVVQAELVQGVGGVRAVPAAVLAHLEQRRADAGFLLLVDEIQTGMFRTGPFLRSRDLGLTPDLVTIGKGASDMLFPFGAALFSRAVQDAVARRAPDLPRRIAERYAYETGYRTLLGTLRRAETEGLEARVRRAGEAFREHLGRELAGCRRVRDVRTFGLLIGIELDCDRVPERWFGKAAPQLAALRMLRHAAFPLLMGFCQYEPHVLKLTPPLSVRDDEIRQAAATIGDVLRRSSLGLLATLAADWAGGLRRRRAALPQGTLPAMFREHTAR